jgi:hypothetical protein
MHNDLARFARSCQLHRLAGAFKGSKGLATRARVGVISHGGDMEHGLGGRRTRQHDQSRETLKAGIHGFSGELDEVLRGLSRSASFPSVNS